MLTPAAPRAGKEANKKTDDEEANAPDSPRIKATRLRFLASPLSALRHPGAALAELFPSQRPGAPPRPAASRSAALLLLAALSALLFVLHRFGAGFAAHFEPAALRATFEAAGPVGGVALYVGAFCVGELMHLPGTLFVAAGVLVWGRALGWLLAVLTAPIALTLPFLVVRRVGGQGYLAEIRFPLFRRILERLDQRPLSTVLLLRCCFFMAPPATYALALSSVSLRNYVLGSTLGLLLPLTFICAFTEKLLYLFGYEAAVGGLGAAHAAGLTHAGAGGLGATGLAAATGLLGDVRAAAGAALDAAAGGVGGLLEAGAAADAADLDAGEQVASAAMAASANLVVRHAS